MRASLLLLVVVAAGAGCLWLPNLEDNGYTACEGDGDCAAGRHCDASMCAPPPWHDTRFGKRQLVVVTNPASTPLAFGTAVPVTVGPGGPISLDDFGFEGRFIRYERDTNTWVDAAVHKEALEDRLVFWIPLPEAAAPGATVELAWLESGLLGDDEVAPPAIVDPTTIFARFDAFEADTLASFRVVGAPRIDEGLLRVDTNQQAVLRKGLVPPVTLQLLARLNGVGCGQTFIGLVGSDAPGFQPPSAGFFVGDDLTAHAEIAPTATSQPKPLAVEQRLGNALARYTIVVDRDHVRFFVDGELFDQDLQFSPAFADDAPLFPIIDVDGDCSVDVDELIVSPLPDPPPLVSSEPVVRLQL